MENSAAPQTVSDDVALTELAVKALAQEAAVHARLVWGNAGSPSFDEVSLEIQPHGSSVEPFRYNVEYHSQLTSNVLMKLARRQPDKQSNTVVVTEFVKQTLAKTLREYHIQFMDVAGNFFLRADGILLQAQGKPPVRLSEQGNPLLTPRTLRVILYFLHLPGLLDCTVREAAKKCGVANATIVKVRRALAEMSFIEDRGRQGCRLLDAERLHCLWAEGFNTILRPKMALGTFSASVMDWEKRARLPEEVYWGGKLACMEGPGKRLSRELFIYSETIPEEIFKQFQILPDPRGNIFVTRPWMDDKVNAVRTGRVHSAFVFADLWSCENKGCREKALELLRRELPKT
ncbi:MAG TPA: hypothetical protein ENK33_00420 [Desulfobacterales bacterium]|nr:hypothetical protein [Desulfobacterales bacterium]